MNNSVVTTGPQTLTINSIEKFQQQPIKNGLPWDLTGGTATLLMTDPAGTKFSFPAIIAGGGCYYVWQVTGLTGTYTRAWDQTDAAGVRQVSKPIIFSVISSPS